MPPTTLDARPRAFARLVPTATPLAAAVVFGTALAGCDACAGVASCEVAPRVGVSGQIVERHGATASPVAGVRVEVTRTGGVATTPAVAAATTDATGWWQASLDAAEPGPVTADVTVAAGGDAVPYRAPNIALRASDRRGDGAVLGRWVSRPYVAALGEVFDAATGARIGGARVTVARASGASIELPPGAPSPMVTEEGSGRFLIQLTFTSPGGVILDFTIARDGYRPVTVRGVTVNPQYEWLPPNVNGDLIFRVPFTPASAGAGAPL